MSGLHTVIWGQSAMNWDSNVLNWRSEQCMKTVAVGNTWQLYISDAQPKERVET
jgi:hypothetical protein